MGWGSASAIFNPVAQALIDAGADDKVVGDVCYTLAKQLTDGDWDTVDESIDEFRDDPVVVHALLKANGWRYIDDYGNAVLYWDEHTNEWVLSDAGRSDLGRAPGTAEGHDQLVQQWFGDGSDDEDRREQRDRALIDPEGAPAA